jgi:hypothetical protein
MPPRYSYWTIIAGGLPTAFRAAEREELVPTFTRIRQKHPDAEMKWFARGKLWDSPAAARDALEPPRGGARGDGPRRDAGGGGARGRDWRPGGEHRDPRQRFKDAKAARNVARRRDKFLRKQGAAAPRDDGPREGGGVPPDRGWKPARHADTRASSRPRDDRRDPAGERKTGSDGRRFAPKREWTRPGGSAGTPRHGRRPQGTSSGRPAEPDRARWTEGRGEKPQAKRPDWRHRDEPRKVGGSRDRDRHESRPPREDRFRQAPPREKWTDRERGSGPKKHASSAREGRPAAPKGRWDTKREGRPAAPRRKWDAPREHGTASPKREWDTPRERGPASPKREWDARREGGIRHQGTEEPTPPPRPRPNREPRPSETPQPSPPPRPSEPGIPPPEPPERGRRRETTFPSAPEGFTGNAGPGRLVRGKRRDRQP